MHTYLDLPASYYALLEQNDNSVLLETSRFEDGNTQSYLFTEPLTTLQIHRAGDVPALLKTIQDYTRQGFYVAGYFSYECGYHLEKLGLTDYYSPQRPLAWFGVYRQPYTFNHLSGETTGLTGATNTNQSSSANQPYTVSQVQFDISEVEYQAKIEQIQEYIRAGQTYQINFTGRYHFKLAGSRLGFYHSLKKKQPVGYGAYIKTAGQHILCFSPELFFRLHGSQITTRPMKGTARRGRWGAEDQTQAEWLRRDEKNRAENVMIVDLLRNDLGRFSQSGSVAVPQLFTVEKYATLFQMTSTVTAQLPAELDYYQLFEQIFPCGSITGAPKLSSMGIIHELESSPRGVYCGAIGYFGPDTADTTRKAVFNVAIRTIVLEGENGEMGIGSGITSDSQAGDEYEECQLKARFLTEPPQDFAILESILWRDGYQRLESHLARMEETARYFDYPFDAAKMRAYLTEQTDALTVGTSYKVRLLLDRQGRLECSTQAITNSPVSQELKVAISPVRTNSQDRFYYHKTTNRALYDQAGQFASQNGYEDLIFLNEKRQVTEGSRYNLFIERDGQLLTPALECGLLNGTYRRQILAENPQAREAVLYLQDLQTADKLYLCNAIRGWRTVRLATEPVNFE